MQLLKRFALTLIGGWWLAAASLTFADPITALLHYPKDPVIGNAHGQVTVVEFFDYECGHCLAMGQTMAAIIQANPDVRFVFKETPLNGPLADFATRVTFAAQRQGKYAELNHALLTTRQRLSSSHILALAKSVGLNMQQLKRDIDSNSVTNQINANYQLWRLLRLTGTPSFYIGQTNASSLQQLQFVLGEMSQRELQYAINRARRA